MTDSFLHNPHQRYNPLTDEWLLLSPQRGQRPWQGKKEILPDVQLEPYDHTCYLCPGNHRANEVKNPHYTGTFVFDNDFPALLDDAPVSLETDHPFFRSRPARGRCRVICFSDRHDLTLAQMNTDSILGVIKTWMTEARRLGQTHKWVQIFENKGTIMGCSNPHPHGQIWASDFIPEEPAKEDRCQKRYFDANGQPLLLDYLKRELESRQRIICENDTWVVLAPYWAVWPFETLLLPKAPVQQIIQLSDTQQQDLSRIMKILLVKYDNLFNTSFAYSMGWHGAPFTTGPNDHWQLHAHYYPPLLRSATVKKFMVGYEMLGCAQRDITPETAADMIRQQPSTHYLEQKE